MAYGVVVLDKVHAMNIDALNRTAKSGALIENGMVFALSGKEAGAGETEMWTVVQPATGANLTHLWMAYSPEIVDTNAQYRGLDPDPRNFAHAIGDPISCFKPQIGDLITLTDDVITGTKSTNGFVVATNGDYQLNWGASAVSGLSLKLLGTTYISIGLGSIGTQRVTAYQFEVVAIA
ncbi:MAG: hypothetical protein H2B01_05945 [Nitrosopumilaceae archaeon]|uniref:Uncharacterized protein n=1 Tax=Candidatus Nitrosomaritimum aestuariumsis TaxID=3342354 RepID=A0AC60W856_9ARCH|nr:hypothetical protein [Nitrosopumilaceae archaeon]